MLNQEENNTEGIIMAMAGLTVDDLRRSSPLHPSRTLRISEAEASRTTTPIDTSRRPRSNPRSRTPMRYESPLDPDEFRRIRLQQQQGQNETERPDARRITIRPNAGRAIGAISIRIHEERPVTPKSRKQGPSHRKLRRWNNDKFHRIANELQGTRAAEVLIQAETDVVHYRNVFDPDLHKSKQMNRFLHDDNLKNVRERFFEGEFATVKSRNKVHPQPDPSAEEWMRRIDSRLRPIVVKACANSYPATCVIRVLEEFLVQQFAQIQKFALEPCWWQDLLLKEPHPTIEHDRIIIEFHFPLDSSQGGFHRLLLHAVAQFHGLSVASRLIANQARFLSVSGKLDRDGPMFYLLDHLENSP